MTLPLLISVPHAGLWVPPEAADYCVLTPEEIAEDGDEGAATIYELADIVAAFTTTRVARAIVDMNRSEADRGPDGVVKTHTCWDVPVYDEPLPDDVVDALLVRYYRPYHAEVTACAGSGAELGIDCHTMAEHGPPTAPDPGEVRPMVCLSNADGTCPRQWIEALARCFATVFPDEEVRINSPFRGGYITRSHACELPWVQLELSRSSVYSHEKKRRCVKSALERWCADELPRLARRR